MTTDRMQVDEPTFRAAAEAAGVPPDQAQHMWRSLTAAGAPVGADRPGPAGALTTANVAWYAGGVISLLAMTVFLGNGWSQYGGGFAALVCLGYLLVFTALAAFFARRGLPTPAGLMATVAVAVVPVVLYATHDTLSLWAGTSPAEHRDPLTWITSVWATMEIATLVAALIAWHLLRFPVLLAPAALAAWFLAMDATGSLVVGDEPAVVPLVVPTLLGLAGLGVGLLCDRAGKRAEGFWLHLAGLLSLWYAIFAGVEGTRVQMAVFGVAGVATVLIAIPLRRREYLVVGGIWVFIALSYLASVVFQDSLLFPVALAAIGIGIVVLGTFIDKAGRKAGVASSSDVSAIETAP